MCLQVGTLDFRVQELELELYNTQYLLQTAQVGMCLMQTVVGSNTQPGSSQPQIAIGLQSQQPEHNIDHSRIVALVPLTMPHHAFLFAHLHHSSDMQDTQDT